MTQGDDHDSLIAGLATAARSRRGRSLAVMAWPYLLAACTAVVGWAGGKIDSKAELQAALELRREDAEKEARALSRHESVMASLEQLKGELFSDALQRRGRIVQLEDGQQWVWRALTESKTLALAGESAASRAKKRNAADRFLHSYDLRVQRNPPSVAYDEIFAQAAIP